ncbi:ABC transporter ATP-binding protein [Thermopetrobacter sp. TC1]|uniref:ABC transporter ATP-binding protein n=1 Tax=Thermopetrobacter sp. TC1 TaxID=1495045 RepID=UPI00056FF6AA|nr:ABC transporter ATP-binding protein [Thermopetrobacter sp. TC1]
MIELKNVVKTFRRTRVLDGLSLTINDGDRIALIGSNGAGKTTMIRCILGEYVHEGDVLVNGLSPRRDRIAVLRHVAFVPQMPPPLRMPVRDLVAFAARLCGTTQARIGEIAARMGLDIEEVARRPFLKLSGGQKQKLLIAIAMGRDADILIMDEPTANLDPAARQILFDLLSENLDKTMIISSHRLEEVAMLVNRVIELDRGRVVLDDRVEDAIDPGLKQKVRITLRRPDEAFAKAISEWGFTSSDNVEWSGVIAGPDRLRFLGMLARYSGVLAEVEMRELAREAA